MSILAQGMDFALRVTLKPRLEQYLIVLILKYISIIIIVLILLTINRYIIKEFIIASFYFPGKNNNKNALVYI